MATVIADWEVCSDCYVFIANGDPSSLDYHYSEEEAERILETMTASLDNSGGYAVAGDLTADFARGRCDCCCTHLAGARYSAAILS